MHIKYAASKEREAISPKAKMRITAIIILLVLFLLSLLNETDGSLMKKMKQKCKKGKRKGRSVVDVGMESMTNGFDFDARQVLDAVHAAR